MASVFDVAAYILKQKGDVSHMKLQKLVYYAQAWSLVWDDEPLFDEPIKAWVNGPVVPSLFHALQGKFKITLQDVADQGDAHRLRASEQETVDRVLAFYGDRDSQWLSDLTHMETPWQTARRGLRPDEMGEREISLADMSEYYSSL